MCISLENVKNAFVLTHKSHLFCQTLQLHNVVCRVYLQYYIIIMFTGLKGQNITVCMDVFMFLLMCVELVQVYLCASLLNVCSSAHDKTR